jgi:hypothetical protein
MFLRGVGAALAANTLQRESASFAAKAAPTKDFDVFADLIQLRFTLRLWIPACAGMTA